MILQVELQEHDIPDAGPIEGQSLASKWRWLCIELSYSHFLQCSLLCLINFE